jgi:hypothetical protein
MSSIFDDPEHWHARAAEARNLAEQMVDEITKANMLHLAASYDKLARKAPRTLVDAKIGIR